MNYYYLITMLFSLIGHAVASAPIDVDMVKQDSRQIHAKELMGKRYSKSIVSSLEQQKDVEKKIYEMVHSKLPKKHKKNSERIAQTIIVESNRHGLDPYFVMAVIAGESSFNPEAVGPVGEIGLMQIRSSTGKWMAELNRSQWKGLKTLRDPIQNIILGTAYIGWLRGKSANNGRLYVAAYNMGLKSVKSAVSRKIYPKDYPRHVMKRYMAFYQEN